MNEQSYVNLSLKLCHMNCDCLCVYFLLCRRHISYWLLPYLGYFFALKEISLGTGY
jgi:hypothetical protein